MLFLLSLLYLMETGFADQVGGREREDSSGMGRDRGKREASQSPDSVADVVGFSMGIG